MVTCADRFPLRFKRLLPAILLALTMLAGGAIAVTPASAAPVTSHALAMYGEPLYPENFRHYDYVNPDAPKGGTLRRAEAGTFDNLNPFLITGRVTSGLQEALALTYDNLMVRGWNEPFTLYGLVAQRVTVPQKRDWIEFHLDPQARFHDGTPVTAKDVAFTHRILMTHGRPNQRRIYRLVKNVVITDKHTIRFELGEGHDRETVMILAAMPVLPAHAWQNREEEFAKTTLAPIAGGGPYRVASVDAGRRVVFERVRDYWAKDKPVARGLYNFDTLRYDFFRDDHIALQALAAGQVDLRREWSAVAWKRLYDFNAVHDGRIIRQEFANKRPMRAKFMIYNMRRAPFDLLPVRKALAYAFDFDWINRNLFLDTQQQIDSLFMNSELADRGEGRFTLPPATGGQREKLRENLRTAVGLLAQAGWHLQDGVMRSDADGRAMRFEILLNDPADEKVALEYSRILRRIGITATVRTVDTTQYIGRMSQFDFDMTIHFWRNTLSPGTEQAVYWGSAAADLQGGFNYTGMRSDKVDALIGRLTSARKREDLVTAARLLDREIMNTWIGVPLYDNGLDRVAYRKGLGFPPVTPVYGPVIESWWYESGKSAKEKGVGKDSAPEWAGPLDNGEQSQ